MTYKVRLTSLTSVVCLGIVLGSPGIAAAEDVEPGEKICDVNDRALDHLSGLVAYDGGYYAVTDGTYEQTQLDIVQLDSSCNTVNVVTSWNDPVDPEDLAVDSEGVLWIADTGDDEGSRETIALHQVSPGGSVANLYRFAFPDGPHDTEALLLQPDGTPIFATKESGSTTFYKPTAGVDQAIDPNPAVPLEAIGTFTIEATQTPGGPENGSQFVTGGAVNADGTKVVIRTYTDAYEWTVKDRDVAAALTGDGDVVVTPLPNEVRGEAISYNADGDFVTASEGIVDDTGMLSTAPALYKYQPATAADEPAADDEEEEEAPSKGFLNSVLDTLGINGILWVIAGLGFIGLIIFLLGLRAIIRARRADTTKTKASSDGQPRSGRSDPDSRGRDTDDYDPDYDDYDDHHEGRSGSVYGGTDYHDEPRSGARYRSETRDEPNTGTVYGGGR